MLGPNKADNPALDAELKKGDIVELTGYTGRFRVKRIMLHTEEYDYEVQRTTTGQKFKVYLSQLTEEYQS